MAAGKATTSLLEELHCPDSEGQKPVGTNGAHSPSARIPGNAAVSPEDEVQSSETSKFLGTMSPPTLGTLRSCFSWSGSLGEFSRTPSPSTRTRLQQFRRKSEPPGSPPEACAGADMCNSKSAMSGDKPQPSQELGWSSRSQESADSTGSLNSSGLSQPSSNDSDSEVSLFLKPLLFGLKNGEMGVEEILPSL